MLKELENLFESETIKPTFEYVHILLALYIFGENYPEGMGRYRLRKELLIGSGTAKSLIRKLNKKINFIYVPDENIRKGHVLTEKGLKFLNKIKRKILLITKADLSILKEIIISSKEASAYLCQVKKSGEKITNGVAQRDAAIKVNGLGATCLVYDGNEFFFKLGPISNSDRNQMKIKDNIQKYIKDQIYNVNLNLEKNDVVILGLGDSFEIARLSALNAALTLI
jgi:predicted transcriptional regulator